MKKKYADEHGDTVTPLSTEKADEPADNDDLAYFESRVRELDQEERRKHSGLTWRDMFRKREMPTFNYQPRFGNGVETTEKNTNKSHTATTVPLTAAKRTIRIRRRFEIDDSDYLKPLPAGKIMLYALLICLLLYWIFS